MKWQQTLKRVLIGVCAFVALITIQSMQLLNSYRVQFIDHESISDNETCKQLAKKNAELMRNNSTLRRPNCSAIFEGSESESCLWLKYHVNQTPDSQLVDRYKDCRKFKQLRGYPEDPNSVEEANFPIAFSISMHENVQQMERLLRLIYWPQNVYCVHVDRKASLAIQNAVRELASCFPNIIVIKNPEYVYWSGYGVLKAVLRCMDALVEADKSWKYFINLASQDFPLKTNYELVQILKTLQGSNDVELRNEMDFNRYWFWHKIISDMNGIPLTHTADFHRSKLPVPLGLKIYKGNLAATLSRRFVVYVLKSSVAQTLADWLNGTDTPDEHFWSTLVHNEKAKAPGFYPGQCGGNESGGAPQKSYITRYVNWRTDNRFCGGMFVRDVCVFGVRDLPSFFSRPQLFANKIYAHFQSAAFDCLEQKFLLRTTASSKSISYGAKVLVRKDPKVPNPENVLSPNLNLSFYRNLEAVKYHRFAQLSRIFPELIPENKNGEKCPEFFTTKIGNGETLNYELKKHPKSGVYSSYSLVSQL